MSQRSPREIAEKLHRKIKRFIDADRHHYEPSGLYEIVAWIADAIEAERESLAAKDREIAELKAERDTKQVNHEYACNVFDHGPCTCDFSPMREREAATQKQIAALQEENAKLQEQAEQKQAAWICFHCGFETSDQQQAAAHFGDRDDAEEFKPICRWWRSMSQEERGEALQDVIRDLNAERDENALLRVKVEGLEYRVDGQLSEIHSFAPFWKCGSINDIFYLYDSMEGRALLAEQQRDALAEALKRTRDLIAQNLAQLNQRDTATQIIACTILDAALTSVYEQKQQEPGK